MAREKVYAEDLNFWRTSRASPDTWLARARTQIQNLGGQIEGEAFGAGLDKAAYMLAFSVNGDKFNIVWPVMQPKKGEVSAARIQAATMLYHYVKSVCLYATVVGARTAFFPHLVLGDGRTAAQLATPELIRGIPKMLKGGTD